jgi:hypothetical protein
LKVQWATNSIYRAQHQSSIDRGKNCFDLHAAAVVAEVERQLSVAPDILLGHCVWLRFNLYLVGTVVAPSSAVASTNRALAYIDILGESGSCDCDVAAMAAGADRGICRRHVVSTVWCCSSILVK